MSGELPGQTPSNSEPLFLREAREVVEEYHGQHSAAEINRLYKGLRDALALAGITPEQTIHFGEEWRRPLRHFIDLPGEFFISFIPIEKNRSGLNIKRIQQQQQDLLYQEFEIVPVGHDFYPGGHVRYQSVRYADGERMDESFEEGWFWSSGTADNVNPSHTIEQITLFTQALQQTISRNEHQIENIQQVLSRLYENLAGKLLGRNGTPKRDVIVLPSIRKAIVDSAPNDELETGIAIWYRDNSIEIHPGGYMIVKTRKNPQEDFFKKGEDLGYIRIKDGKLVFYDQHYVLMKARELEQAISS